MSRFFFDFKDGSDLMRDDVGLELAGVAEAQAEAIRALPGIVRDEVADGDDRDFEIDVRDEGEHLLLTVSLTLRIRQVRSG